jgi:hypothetical protein
MNVRILGLLLIITCVCCEKMFAQDEALEVTLGRIETKELTDLTGLDIFLGNVKVKRGQRLRAALFQHNEGEPEPKRILHREATAQRDGVAECLALFRRPDQKLGSVLLSEEPEMTFRLAFMGAATGGLNGVIPAPLAEVPVGNRKLDVHDTPQKFVDGSYELFRLYRTDAGGAVLFPRVSFRIEAVK